MKKLLLVLSILMFSATSGFAQNKSVFFSHQSVGRNMIGNRLSGSGCSAFQDKYSTYHIRDIANTHMDSRIQFWDHDYSQTSAQPYPCSSFYIVPLRRADGLDGWKHTYPSEIGSRGFTQRVSSQSVGGWMINASASYSYLPGVVSFAQIATNCLKSSPTYPSGSISTWVCPPATHISNATAWRNFLQHTYRYVNNVANPLEGEAWDLVVLKPGYKQMHIPTEQDDSIDAFGSTIMSLETLKSELNAASDWWHSNPNTFGRSLAICPSSPLRSPTEYTSTETSGWRGIGSVVPYTTLYPGTNGTAEDRQIADIETLRYRAFCDWLKKVWINRHPENRTFLFWEVGIAGQSGGADSLYTNSAYRSIDHHLDTDGSNATQAKFVTWLNETLYPSGFGSTGATYPTVALPTPTISRITLSRTANLEEDGAIIQIFGSNFGTTLERSGYPEGKVVIGTNSSYANSIGTATAQLHVGQEIQGWSDTMITIKTRLGSVAETCQYTTLNGKYLYVLNRVGNPSAGFRLVSKTLALPHILQVERGVF